MASLIPLRLVVTIETIVTAEMAANNNWPRRRIGLMGLTLLMILKEDRYKNTIKTEQMT